MGQITLNCPSEFISSMAHTPVADITVDTILVVAGRVTVAYADTKNGIEGEFIHRAEEIEVDKAAVTIVSGETAYYHQGNDNFTNVSTGAIKCGMFTEAALNGAAVAVMRLDNSVNL